MEITRDTAEEVEADLKIAKFIIPSFEEGVENAKEAIASLGLSDKLNPVTDNKYTVDVEMMGKGLSNLAPIGQGETAHLGEVMIEGKGYLFCTWNLSPLTLALNVVDSSSGRPIDEKGPDQSIHEAVVAKVASHVSKKISSKTSFRG